MDDTLHTTLAGWGDFYLLTGTAAATLTGLQFIVQTLLSSGSVGDDPEEGIAAFGSPTVVHFSLTLLLSAVLRVPWPGYGSLRVTLGALSAGALGYSAVVLQRARRQRSYAPVTEDWVWHILLPCVAYAALLLVTVLLGPGAVWTLFVVAAATLLLLCVGIHNSWDTVTYLTVIGLRAGTSGGEPASPRRNSPGTHDRR